MKMQPTQPAMLDELASKLCKGSAVPEWVITRLQNNALLVGYHTHTITDDAERLLFQSALRLRDWLPLYARAADMLGEDYPDCIDDVSSALDELIPFLAKGVEMPMAHRPPDLRKRLCAGVCLGIWRDIHGIEEPSSPKLWEACEAYWVACGQPPNASGNLKQWKRFLLLMSEEQNPPEKS
jgi:hypothetical protein